MRALKTLAAVAAVALLTPPAHAGPGALEAIFRQKFGGQVAGAGATNGQALAWNSSTLKWEPTTISVSQHWSRSGTVLSPTTSGDTAQVGDGTRSAPAYSFTNETGLGQYRQGNGTVDFASGHTAGAHYRIHPTLSSPTAASTIQVYNRDNGSGTPLGGLVLYTLPPGYTSSGIFQANSGLLVADGNMSAGLTVGTSGGASCPLYFATDAVVYEKRLGVNIFHGSDVVMGWSSTASGTGLFGSISNDVQLKRDGTGVLGLYAAGSNYGALALASSVTMRAGAGSPEAIVTANIGSVYLRTDGASGTTLYTKTTGNGLNTGWSTVGGSSLSGISNPAAGRLTWATGSGAVTHLLGPSDAEFLLQAGTPATATSTGNSFTLAAGDGGATSGAGGVLVLRAGHGAGGNSAGGQVNVTGGSAIGSGVGGKVAISGGGGSDTGAGGNVEIQAAPGGGTSGNGGDVIAQGGSGGASGNGGNLWLDGGEGVGTNKAGGWVRLRAGQNTGSGAEGYISFEVARTGAGGTEVARIIKQGALVQAERTTDPTTANLAANAAVAMYNKNNKLVFAFNNAGTMTYVSIALDGAATTWTQSTTAP